MEYLIFSCDNCKKNNSTNDIDEVKKLINCSYFVRIDYDSTCDGCKSIEEPIKKLNLNKLINVSNNCMYCEFDNKIDHYCVYNKGYKPGVFSENGDPEEFINKAVPGSIFSIFDAHKISTEIKEGISKKSLVLKNLPSAIADLNLYYLVCEKEINS